MIRVLVFPCTYRCDGKCIMCTIHERSIKDRPIEFFEDFFKHPKLNDLESVNITGGEPTLRTDLKELIDMISRNCKKLNEIIINSNGLNTNRIVNSIREILRDGDKRIKYHVYISLDSLDEVADHIRGVKNSSENCLKTLRSLKELKRKHENLSIGISTTITSSNYNKLDEIYSYSMKEGFNIEFVYATVNDNYIKSEEKAEQFVLEFEQKQWVKNFIERIKSHEREKVKVEYYDRLIDILQDKFVKKNCIFRKGSGLLLEPDGRISLCGMTRKSFLGDLKEENLDLIFERPIPNINSNCEKCETNSYYNWSFEIQKKVKEQMLINARSKMREMRRHYYE